MSPPSSHIFEELLQGFRTSFLSNDTNLVLKISKIWKCFFPSDADPARENIGKWEFI
jgi:hypothetical protein